MLVKLTEIEADQALLNRQIDGLVASLYENERPLAGLAGLLDWRFHGAISSCLRSGAISGQAGECIYFPVTKNGNTYRIILAGAGTSSTHGSRTSLPAESLAALRKNIEGLKLNSVGISQKDFGNPTEDFLSKNLKIANVELRVTV